jgi:hypothetical protein
VTAQIIPTFDDPYSSQVTNLDGTPYLLTFAWNMRSSTWYLSIATTDGTPIASGIKLVCNFDLLRTVVSPARPPGRIVAISNTTDNSPPGLEDLIAGGRCALCYSPLADLQAAGIA